MNNRKWMQLLTVLIIASILLIGAVQKFDTIQAKKIIVTGSGGLVLGVSSGAMDINGKQLILDADADTSFTADTDDQIDIEISGADDFIFTANKFEVQTGSVVAFNENQNISLQSPISGVLTLTLPLAANRFDIATGNLKVGDGTPTFTQTGESAYIEGVFEAGGDQVDTPATTFLVVYGVPITPTGMYQPITSATSTAGEAVTNIAAPTDDTTGKVLELHNINASQVITIDGTGADVECKADIVMGAGDILGLRWNGTDWNCRYFYDNS